MPQLSRGKLQCHYCGKRSDRKWEVHIRSWKCNYCEAVNYLDENGQITDPPVSLSAKQPSPQYARYARRTQSPDLSPQESDIFCKQCMTNQHFVQQNLAEYLPDPSHPEYNKFLDNLEDYKADLERRYPQVCVDCAPRVNARLKATTYAAKADNLRRGLARKKASSLTPEWRKWGWRRLLILIGGVLWWASILGQVTWHLLGILPHATKQMRLRSISWYGQWTCAANALMSQEIQLSCLEATKDSVWRAFYMGAASFWWNNALSTKLYSRERRLRGLGSYLLVQFISLSVRAVVLLCFEHTEWIPKSIPTNAIHGTMIVFLVFTTLTSLRTVKLSAPQRPNLTDHHPVQVDPAATRPAYQQNSTPISSQTTSFSTSFPVSALSKPLESASVLTPPATQSFAETEYDGNEMDWTPTGPSQYTQFSPQPKLEYRRPEGPSPFRGTLPPAPKPPAHKIRNPKPFIPASQDRKNNFMKEIRGELRAATGSPSDDEDGTFGFGSRKKNNADFVLAPGNMRDYQAEGAATGLENLFNSAFTIKETTAATTNKEQEKGIRRSKEKEKGYVMSGKTVRENMIALRAIVGISALLVVVLAFVLSARWFSPKSALEGLLYEKEALEEVREVVDVVQEYVDT
ncbi:uncharacterized protein PV09_03825 [Verruconis gallopava]|uniref:Ima1 N-terminal domain-containing protein n=1 Tax=Verruconis gallopava TaxID=253628 RepID=A0A0D2AFN2_9PEZI|nr:uncharacterized protein PV09_03825 [Verruconis gallopava]KIW05300.1 hypothetical protein PV09_03825 [Verruconis gallopava]